MFLQSDKPLYVFLVTCTVYTSSGLNRSCLIMVAYSTWPKGNYRLLSDKKMNACSDFIETFQRCVEPIYVCFCEKILPYPESSIRWDVNKSSSEYIEGVHFAGLLDVQNILSADTGISRQTEGHSFGDHLIIESVSVTPSSVIEASIVFCVFMTRVTLSNQPALWTPDTYIQGVPVGMCQTSGGCSLC
jgi:hypothetical protein